MLTTDFEIEEEGMTVPYPPLFDDTRRNHGFVDLRGRPDLAAQIREATRSPALKSLLIALSDPTSPLFTLGCDLGAHEELWSGRVARHVAGGYVQVVCASYLDRSPEDYTAFGYAVAQTLEDKVQDHNWVVRFVLQLVVLKLDDLSELVSSLTIWFYASGHTFEAALASREVLIGSLREALTDELLISSLKNGRNGEDDSGFR